VNIETTDGPIEGPAGAGADFARGGIQSVDAALVVLRELARMRGSASLSELARRCAMPSSKVHRYLASFINAGLVAQRVRSGTYDLAKGAIALGLAAMTRLDLVNKAADRLEEIVDKTGALAMLAIWGNQGPTVVRLHRDSSLVITSIGLGMVFPLLNSATGRVFMAYGQARAVSPLVEAEIARAKTLNLEWPDLIPSAAAVESLCDRIRRLGYASIDGRFIPGLNAISAPVLNWQGEAEAAITLASGDAGLIKPDSPALAALLELSRQISIEPLA
jgi:DNA-binding IclR family transcriptional regulator